LPSVNKTKHPPKKEEERERNEQEGRTQVQATRANHKGNMNKSSTQNPPSCKEHVR
jgi:hypothetical protein